MITRRKCRTRRELGMTLMEAMLAMAVFTVGALGLLRLMYSGNEGLATSSRSTTATMLARNRLDELMQLPYDHADLNTGAHDDGTRNIGPTGGLVGLNNQGTGNFESADGNFWRKWTVAEDGTHTFKTVTVTVYWYDFTAKGGQGSEAHTLRSVAVLGGKSQQ